jgi:hypothetical protein
MKRRLILAGWLLGACLLSLHLEAQIRFVAPDSLVFVDDSDTEAVDTQSSIVDRINRIEPGKGTVRVIQDEEVAKRLGRPAGGQANEATKSVTINGWRIQVFAGNNQRLSKEEAFRKEADVKSVFPELATYVHYTAPFWRLRVGDFQSFRDANDMLNRLKRALPSYGREMSIVKEKIIVER